MKFSVDKSVLLEGIQAVQNIISSKAALPILSHILLETGNNSLRLTATDLDIGISCVIPVNVLETGSVSVPAKRFGDIIRELPGTTTTTINTKKNNLVLIETENCQFKIIGLPKEEFPKLPEFKDKEAVKIDQGILKEMLALTSFAVSFDETRYILNGILFKIENNALTLVATDGKRLAVIERKLKQSFDKTVKVIVPIKTIHELNRNLSDGKEVSLILGNNQVLFDLDSVVVISRLIEGEFPDYRQVIPAPSDTKMQISREQFLLAVRRASLLATPDYQAVKFEVFQEQDGCFEINAGYRRIAGRGPRWIYPGPGEIMIGFNPNYLIDVLRPGERVNFELTDGEKPGVIRVDGYIYIVLPMRLG
jgi:DNA polymerase III, beta subunit